MTNLKKKGIAIIWTMITGSIMLLLATIMINATVKESKMVINFAASTKVSNAAKSGVTWATWCINNQEVCGYSSDSPDVPDIRTFMIDGIAITVRITDQEEDGKTVYYVESLGSDDRVVRKFNYRYPPKEVDYLSINMDGKYFAVNPPDGHPNSYSFTFNMWLEPSFVSQVARNNLSIYFDNSLTPSADSSVYPGNLMIRYEYNAGSPRLLFGSTNTTMPRKDIPLKDPSNPTQNLDISKPFVLTVTLKYVKNVNTSLTVRVKDMNTGIVPDITYRKTIELPLIDMGTLNRVVFPNNTSPGGSDVYNLGDYIKVSNSQQTFLCFANFEDWGNP